MDPDGERWPAVVGGDPVSPAEVNLDKRLDVLEQRLVAIETQLQTVVKLGRLAWPAIAAVAASLGIQLV